MDLSDFEKSLISNLKFAGIEKQLNNDLFYYVKERSFIQGGVTCWIEKESMDYLRRAQVSFWFDLYYAQSSEINYCQLLSEI